MSWATLGTQELISGADLTSAVATAGYTQRPSTSIPNDGVVLNETEINTYVYCTIAPISGNCPAKQDLTPVTPPPTDPPTSTLTLTYESAQWVGTLSDAIPSTSVDIQYGVVNGWNNACSGGSAESADMWSDFNKIVTNGFRIWNGTYIAHYSPYESLTAYSTNYKIQNSVTVDGTTRTNGATFMVGPTTVVTLVITIACTNYYS